MNSFLILGGTGKVGRRLSHIIETAGHEARRASRRAAVRFDWRDDATWRSALSGVTGVFIVGPGSASDWSSDLTRFLSVAQQEGAKHAVLLSARGVEFLPTGAVAAAERALRRGPVPWTILRPSHFSQNFTEAMFAPVDGRVLAPVGQGTEPFIDVADIAAVAATVLTSGQCDGTTLELSGPEAITFDEAAAVLQDASGAPVRFEDEEDAAHVERLRSEGTPEGYIQWRMAMLHGIRSGADAYLSDGVQRVLGRSPVSFHEWARREARSVSRACA
jgi:uncharacterized protein YbjT (DUF2867 family)